MVFGDCSHTEHIILHTDFIKTPDTDIISYYWHRPFRELGEVSQQVTYPETATCCLGRVHRTNPLLCCPEAGWGHDREGEKNKIKSTEGALVCYLNLQHGF